MADSFNLLRRVKSLDISPEQLGYTGVVIFAGQDEEGNNIEYRAGDETGTVLEISNEWGSQAQANAIYQKIRGFRYQPYKAAGSRIDPSAEIGDAVTISDIYSGIFVRQSTYGRSILTDLEAPSKEEVEHEFQVKSPTSRQYERFTRSVRASLSLTASKIAAEVEDRKAADEILRATLDIQAQEIAAKVSQEGGDTSSFWWKLLYSQFSVGNQQGELFRVDKNGAFVQGEIRATSGKIGGFDIRSDYLSYNNQTWGGTNTIGAYLGRSGFQMGRDFSVDMQGHAVMASADIRGTLRAGDLIYGGDAGYLSGSGLESHTVAGNRLQYGTVSTSYTSSGINTSLGYANFADDVFNGNDTAGYMMSYNLKLDGHWLNRASVTIDGVTLKYVSWI